MRIGYGIWICIENYWWKWDEEEDALRDGRGNIKQGWQGEEEVEGWREGESNGREKRGKEREERGGSSKEGGM